MPNSFTPIQQLYAYHAMDRDVFSRLVHTLMRLPHEALLVMAIWFWFEDIGFPDLIPNMSSFSDIIIDAIANEATACLRCLESSCPPPGPCKLPLTTRLVKADVTLHTIYGKRYTAITGIKNFLTTVCSKIFSDIIQTVLPASSYLSPHLPLYIPGFPHLIFGNVVVMPHPPSFREERYSRFLGGLWSWSATGNASEDDRTMFLTFSRGFPVTENEVKDLFRRSYGENCVQGVHMQESNGSNDQPLFARLVLDKVATLDNILNGSRIAKFRINGKHIWARKYERRDLPA